ncbi:MAG: A/G-specific adenine glycosylase [Proteobacteria bacterium]|nr:A/G-specific adenine glycosylase [Pseudomonadota bacterium]
MRVFKRKEQVFSNALLAWYDKNQRHLPWRLSPSNPYYTWLSEIMLQQTTVATVVPYFYKFVEKWPTVQALAAASLDEILVEWQGLGYYSRARNLHHCAKLLAERFPTTEEELLKLPGIGPYTAAAIASIAFGQKAAAVDGNVVRVLSRYFAIPTVNPVKDVKEKLLPLVPEKRCGDFTQSLMELGALICRPKSPLCSACPLQKECGAYALRRVEEFPLMAPKQKLPTRYATAFILKREDGAILLRKRPPQGLLGGMMEVPTTSWEETPHERKGRRVRHTFTHFHLEVDVCHHKDILAFEGTWVQPQELKNYALPTLMKKILKGE